LNKNIVRVENKEKGENIAVNHIFLTKGKKFMKKYGIILSLSSIAATVIGAEQSVSSMKEPLPLKLQAVKPMVEKWLCIR
jgi:hypothetical protein